MIPLPARLMALAALLLALVAGINVRLHTVETTLSAELPPLKEVRTWVMRGMLFVVTAVAMALLGLVIVGRHP